jgi:hypothetical protein
MSCEPILILLFTSRKRFVILNINTHIVIFTNLTTDDVLYPKFKLNEKA